MSPKTIALALALLATPLLADWSSVRSPDVYPVEVGYSSAGRFDIGLVPLEYSSRSFFEWRGADVDFPFDFGFSFSLIRVDVRLDKNDEYDVNPINLGTVIPNLAITGTPLGLLFLTDLWSFAVTGIMTPWLTAGGETLTFIQTKRTAWALSESHTFEWWLYKKNGS